MSALIDLKGQRFGRLLVVSLLPKRAKNKNAVWVCLCDCGNISEVMSSNLRRKTTQSCGCLHREITSKTNSKDLVGKRFGKLLVVEKEIIRKGDSVVWKCLCDCGNKTFVISFNLNKGRTKSCGCLRKELGLRTTHGQTGTSALNTFLENKRRAAKLQRTPKWLTDEDWEKIRLFYKNRPKGMTVDHFIALQAKLASGFHTLDNLQYLTKSENSRKHNKFIPFIRYRNGKIKYLEKEFWAT